MVKYLLVISPHMEKSEIKSKIENTRNETMIKFKKGFYDFEFAISIENKQNIKIDAEDNINLNCFGISLKHCKDIDISNINLINTQPNISAKSDLFIDNCQNVILTNNNLSSKNDNRVANNTGIKVMNSENIILEENYISNISAMTFALGIEFYSTKGIIKRNNISYIPSSEKDSYGIFLADSEGLIEQNTISSVTSNEKNALAIFFHNSKGFIQNNNLSNISSKERDAFGVFVKKNSEVNIENNKIVYISSKERDAIAIAVKQTSKANIRDNKIANIFTKDKDAFGILLSDAESNIRNNEISNISAQKTSYGMALVSSQGKIRDNNISNVYSKATAHGIRLAANLKGNVKHNVISNVFATEFAVGIDLFGSGGTVESNKIEYISSKDKYSSGISFIGGSRGNIRQNNISNISVKKFSYGIYLSSSYGNVEHNEISNISSKEVAIAINLNKSKGNIWENKIVGISSKEISDDIILAENSKGYILTSGSDIHVRYDSHRVYSELNLDIIEEDINIDFDEFKFDFTVDQNSENLTSTLKEDASNLTDTDKIIAGYLEQDIIVKKDNKKIIIEEEEFIQLDSNTKTILFPPEYKEVVLKDIPKLSEPKDDIQLKAKIISGGEKVNFGIIVSTRNNISRIRYEDITDLEFQKTYEAETGKFTLEVEHLELKQSKKKRGLTFFTKENQNLMREFIIMPNKIVFGKSKPPKLIEE